MITYGSRDNLTDLLEGLRSKLKQVLVECNCSLFLEGDVSSSSLAEK